MAELGVIGFALSVPGLIEQCISYGQLLHEKIHNYRHMAEIVGLNMFLVGLVGGEAKQILLFFKAQHTDANPDDHTFGLIQQLRLSLEKLQKILPDSDPNAWNKVVFSFHGKKSLESACAELEDWHARLLRHFFVRAMLGAPGAAESDDAAGTTSKTLSRVQRIRSAITDPETTVDRGKLRLDAFDNAVSFRQLEGSNVAVTDDAKELVEYRQYAEQSSAQTKSNTQSLVRDLAARLHEIEPSTMGLLRCNGFTPEPWRHRFALRFQYPAGKAEACSLHSLLVHKSNERGIKHPLGSRVSLARKLASAVLYMHTCGFVHKSIRPDNILMFSNSVPAGEDSAKHTYPRVIGEPFLVGFDSMRRAVEASNMIPVEDWKKNIYLHPDRHRMAKGDEYTVRHDLYSLGVVLLEIALWASFADEGAGGKAHLVSQKVQDRRVMLSAEDLKALYLQIAKVQVPRIIGQRYADIVVSCLEGLKDEEEGGLLNDQDGIVVETAYVSQVLGKLEEIAM